LSLPFLSFEIVSNQRSRVRPTIPPRRRGPKPDRRRALELLAASPDGATEALMRNFNSAVNLQVKCELPLTMGGFQMAIEIGAVQSVSMMSGDPGWGFHLRDCTGRHWITISYRTEADAKAAREKIEAATADAEIMVH
jgi:hypothetical protein